MDEMKKQALRDEILAKVREYYRLAHEPAQTAAFVPGETRVNYAGRVFDAEEMCNLVDSSLEFWLTAGRYTREFETGLARFLGVKHALFVNSGSSANLLAFMALTSPLLGERRMILQLVRNDLKARYAGSAFGMAWAFVQPLVSMLVMWAVFQVGFRTSPVDDIEFILWYIAANVPWIYYSDGVNASAGCLYEYNYLVKKMRFRTELLPLVNRKS